MRSPVRVAWRSGTLGVKVDECLRCGHTGRHRLERQYLWLEIGPVGVLPLWIRHGLECADCWMWTPLSWRQARRGVRTGSLPLPERARPLAAASGAGDARMPDFDHVNPSRSLDGGTVYLGVWAIALAILIGLAVQPAGIEGVHESSPSCLVVVGLAAGQAVPTPPLTVSETLCVLPHNFEPLAEVPLDGFAPSATMPPYPVVEGLARAACASAFKDAFGSPPPGGPVPLVLGADPRDWARGDRFTWCAAGDPKQPWPAQAFPR